MDRWTPIAYYIHEEADGIASARSAVPWLSGVLDHSDEELAGSSTGRDLFVVTEPDPY